MISTDRAAAVELLRKGDVVMVSVDGGEESYRRIKDPASLFTATVAIPFESMGQMAVDALDKIQHATAERGVSTQIQSTSPRDSKIEGRLQLKSPRA